MNYFRCMALVALALGCAPTGSTRTPAQGSLPAPNHGAAAVATPAATPTNPEQKRCGDVLGASPFGNAKAGHILLANFYGIQDGDPQFADSVTVQLEQELRRFKQEEFPKMAVEVPLGEVEFRRLKCVIDSHPEAERVGKLWGADLVIWGKALRNDGNQPVNVQQSVNTGTVRAAGKGRISAGVVQAESQKPYSLTPSATLTRPEASFRQTGKAVALGSLAYLDLPTIVSSKPFQLVQSLLGLHCYQREAYALAARFFERSVKDVIAPQDRNLGTLYQLLGRADLELPGGHQQAIEFSRIALREHEGTGTSTEAALLNNIGSALRGQGKPAEALSFFQRALAIDAKALGNDHPNVGRYLSSIGAALRDQSKPAEALSYYQRALAIDEKAFGKDHPSVGRDLNNIGAALRDLGKRAEALTLYQRALAIDEEAFGTDHPTAGRDLNNIGEALHGQGKPAEALGFFQRALVIYEKSLGKDHPKVAILLGNIGGAFQGQGKPAEALSFYQRALAIDEKAFGTDHLDVANDLNNIGWAFQSQGKPAEALSFYRRALVIYEKSFGRDHSDRILLRTNLALCLAAVSGWRKNTSKGAIVSLPQAGSPGEAAGLQTGDWVVRYAGIGVVDGAHFIELTQASTARARVPIELIRKGMRKRLLVTGGKLGVWCAN